MRNVLAGKISLLLLLTLFAAPLMGQRMHHFDVRPFNLGFTMGPCVSSFKATTQVNTLDPSTGQVVKRVSLKSKPGIYLGLISNLKISNNFDVRFLPSVSLEQRDFIFHMDPATMPPGEETELLRKVEASNLNLPLCIKFKSNYYNRYRVYFMTGVQASFNLASNKKVKNDPNLIKTESFDSAWLAAFGIDLYGERLKVVPEIRYTLGFNNIYVPDRTRFATAISSFYAQNLILTINFE